MPDYMAPHLSADYYCNDPSFGSVLFHKVLSSRLGNQARLLDVLSHGYRWDASENYGFGKEIMHANDIPGTYGCSSNGIEACLSFPM